MNATKPLAQKASLSAYQVGQFRRDGFIPVRQVFAPQEIAEIRETFMHIARNGPVKGLSEGTGDLNRGGTAQYAPSDPLSFYPRMMHPHAHPEMTVGPLSMRYMLHPKLEGILTALLAEEPLAVQSMFYFKPPQSRGQALHQDNFYLRVKPGTCVAAWLALDDADEENGGIQCVSNTQNHPIQCPEQSNLVESFTTERVTPPKGSRLDVVPLKAGDVLFFNGNVIHGSGPNRSKTRFRRSLIFHYVPHSTSMMSEWYKTPYRFNGALLPIAPTTGGGPCGTADDAPRVPH